MRDEDLLPFCAVLNGLAAVKPGTGGKLSAEALHVWWNKFQPWSLEEFSAAAAHLMDEVEFMPNPYHFHQLRKRGELTAQEAWELVVCGAPLMPGSRIERVACMVGRSQQAILHADVEKDLPHIRRRFIDTYDLQTDVESVRAALPNVVSSEHRQLPRKRGESIGQIASRIERRMPNAQEQPASRPVAGLLLPAPETPSTPRVLVDARDKVQRLLAVGMSDEEVAKVSGQAIELVRDVRAGAAAKEVAA